MLIRSIIICLLFIQATSCTSGNMKTHEDVSKEFFSYMIKRDYKECWKYIDKELKKTISFDQFTSVTETILQQMGNDCAQITKKDSKISTDIKTKKEYISYEYQIFNLKGEVKPVLLVIRFYNKTPSKINAFW